MRKRERNERNEIIVRKRRKPIWNFPTAYAPLNQQRLNDN